MLFRSSLACFQVADGTAGPPSPAQLAAYQSTCLDMAASRVFVRWDGARKPLEPLWEGPFCVLQRSRHVFRIQRGSREDSVSVLCLKPADVPASCPDGQPKQCGCPKSVRLALRT